MHTNLKKVGGVYYSEEEKQFAKEIQKSLGSNLKKIESAATVQQLKFTFGKASADTGDVSWTVPTTTLGAATWVPGTPVHSWQAVAAGGTSIGHKGMMVAAKTIALAAVDIYNDPSILKQDWLEFEERRYSDFKYEALLGSRLPALDYRK